MLKALGALFSEWSLQIKTFKHCNRSPVLSSFGRKMLKVGEMLNVRMLKALETPFGKCPLPEKLLIF